MNLFDQVSNDIKKCHAGKRQSEIGTLRGIKKEFLEAKQPKAPTEN